MKRLYLLLILFVAVWTASANPIDRRQARQQAEKFLKEKGGVISGESAARSIGRKGTADQPFYVFNIVDDRGFVIVAGDDQVDPIIGYTTQGCFDENNLPVNFKAWLEQIAAGITAIAAQPAQARAASAPKATTRPVAIHNRIEPLIITSWNQGNTDNVYNSHLPLVSGQRPCTGCVATAGAQIMYYYHRDLPDMTQPVPGYSLTNSSGKDVSNGADTSADLPAIQFKWDLMKTQYSYKDPEVPNSEEEDAVADLMLYCGYAAQMNYGLADKHGGSSASTSTLADGFSKYFGFNPNTWKDVQRKDYSISEWDEIIYNELACGRPIIYSGSFNGGHAFICDGYDGAGMYHFNWGWGGSYNGFFKLQATNPKGESDISDMGYIEDNYCIIGLQPNNWPDIVDPNADDTWEIPEIDGIVATASNVRVEGTEVKMGLGNYNDDPYAFGYGIGKLNNDGTITPIDTNNEIYKNWGTLNRGQYYPNVSFDFSSYDLSDGKQTLVPISLLNGETEWRRCKPADLYFEVTTSSGEKTIIAHPIEDLQINEFELATGGTPGNSQSINLRITNNGDNLEKTLYVYVAAVGDEGFGEYASSQTIRMASGSTKDYRLRIGKLEAGDYTLRVLNKYKGDVVLAQKEITISQDLQATNFEVTGKKYANKTLRVDATIENHAGDYAVPLYLFASTTNTKKFFYAAGSAIERGGSEVVTFYFHPSTSGTWNIWITTDQNGENVIGQSTVEVSESHPASLSISSEVQNLVFDTIMDEKMVINVDVTNNGSYDYDDVIEVYLFKSRPDNSGYGDLIVTQQQEILLEPSAKTSLKFSFDDLEDGSKYFYYIYYYSTENSQIKHYYVNSYPAGYSLKFVYTAQTTPEPVPGDANGDGVVNAMDIADIINYMMNSPTSTGTFVEEAADANGDGTINAADIVWIANTILNAK